MQDLISKMANLLHQTFCVDQTSFITQQFGGAYKRTYGVLNPERITQSILNSRSIGTYQKNRDSTVRWVCFDFDVAKAHVGANTFEGIIEKLNIMVDNFCLHLTSLDLPYLIEFSGNRGIHVWLTFSVPLPYPYAYEFSRAIFDLVHEDEADEINIDFFPASRTPSKGVGLGVKLPLSKHTKSGLYSLLLSKSAGAESAKRINTLDSKILEHQIDVLNSHRSIGLIDIERTTPILIDWEDVDKRPPLRIASITVSKKLTPASVLNHWLKGGKLNELSQQIQSQKSLSHGARRLLVGMLLRVKHPTEADHGKNILQELFSKLENYDPEITAQAIESLAGFNFPTQLQIESVCGPFERETYEVGELIKICIPGVESFDDHVLEITSNDAGVVRSAELRYLYQNDEVQCPNVIKNLKSADEFDLLHQVHEVIAGRIQPRFYEHFRQEENKVRRLISQDAATRLATSSVVHQLSCTLNFQPSFNSRGYQLAPAFKGGYIFRPWLDLWVEFIAAIRGSLEDSDNKDYFIVKTDISSFYDRVPHENLKRLMMGGVNKKIDAALACFSAHQKEKYRILLEALFRVNSSMTINNRGLPQGPAYARFLSEIYLDNIDVLFESELALGTLVLYQRYVDDIFFVCKTEEIARDWLQRLDSQVKSLGLSLNVEKTLVGPVRDFDKDFEKFSAQSKYAVDKASKGYENATPTQKNLAISELLNIIQSDSCNDDLAFIFSHLNGVPEIDAIKETKVVETLKRAVGRGSMLRHLFMFVLAKAERWHMLLEIENYDALQSEVLSTCILHEVRNHGSSDGPLLSLIDQIVPRLKTTPLTEENIAALWLAGVPLNFADPHPRSAMVCLAANMVSAEVNVSDVAVSALTLTLNSIESMREFVACIFPLCMSVNTSKTSLNVLAQTFYAKLANDHRLNALEANRFPNMTFEQPSNRFYQLLCLFSLSNQNGDIDLLKSAWQLATELSNAVQCTRADASEEVWFEKLKDLEISAPINHLIVSSIIDGSIYRGGQYDAHGIYEAFHHKIVVFVAGEALDSGLEHVKAALEELKTKANFYKWILDREGVRRFPSDNWFEKNICENDLIILTKDTEVLVRRPTDKFKDNAEIMGQHNGYGERIEPFCIGDFISVKDALHGLNITEKIDKLVCWLEAYQLSGFFPNIFSQDRLIHAVTHKPFSVELSNHTKILFEDAQSRIAVYPNNISSFVECFFRLVFEDIAEGALKPIWSKYIEKLPESLNKLDYVRFANNQLKQMSDVASEVNVDFAMASALYSIVPDGRPERRISTFVDVYEKFNNSIESQHIYCIDDSALISDSTVDSMFDSLEMSFSLVSDKVMPTTLFNLGCDLKNYRADAELALATGGNETQALRLLDFRRARINISQISKVFDIFGLEYSFDDSFVVNCGSRKIEPYETTHQFNIKNAEHLFFFVQDSKLYLFPVASAISKAFLSIKKRRQALSKGNALVRCPSSLMPAPNLSSLAYYDKAIRNIAAQRDVDDPEAKRILESWLCTLPQNHHQNLCLLIAAHFVMRMDEIDRFVNFIAQNVAQEISDVFFIKTLDDVNGTQRILARDPELLRKVAGYGPLRVVKSKECATLAVDLVLSGSQIVKAIKYYVLHEGRDEQYYCYSNSEKECVAAALKSLKKLNIIQIFHTSEGIENIQRECREFLGPDFSVSAIGGQNIDSHALFGNSVALGVNDKTALKAFLSDKAKMDDLYSHLHIPKEAKRNSADFKGSRADGIDLVGRYRSLPKKCFYFLHASTLHNDKLSPFLRTRELYEMPPGL